MEIAPLLPVDAGVDGLDEERHPPRFLANPLIGLLAAFRWSLLGQEQLPVAAVAWSVVATLLSVVAGTWTFTRAERQFADVI